MYDKVSGWGTDHFVCSAWMWRIDKDWMQVYGRWGEWLLYSLHWRPRRFLFTGTSTGSVQMWDLTTALDQYYASRGGTNGPSTALSNAPVAERGTTNTVMGLKVRIMRRDWRYWMDIQMTPSISSLPSSLLAALAGPTPQELLALIGEF